MDLSRFKQQALDAGLVDLAYGGFIFRHPINNVRPITKPDDFIGIKFRTMGVPVHVDTYKALGANVVAVGYAELYSAMQMGVVDGCENAYTSHSMMKFSEVAKYITTLPVFNNLMILSASKIAFDKLPAEYQQVLRDGAQMACDVLQESLESADAEAIETMKAAGNEFNAPDLEPFVKATQAVRDHYLAEMEPWVRDTVAEIEKYK